MQFMNLLLETETTTSSSFSMIIMIAGMFAIIYVMIYRPQKHRQAQEQETRKAIDLKYDEMYDETQEYEKQQNVEVCEVDLGDEIETLSGICGRVISISETKVAIEVGVQREIMRIARENIKANKTKNQYGKVIKLDELVTTLSGICGRVISIDEGTVTIEVGEARELMTTSIENINFNISKKYYKNEKYNTKKLIMKSEVSKAGDGVFLLAMILVLISVAFFSFKVYEYSDSIYRLFYKEEFYFFVFMLITSCVALIVLIYTSTIKSKVINIYSDSVILELNNGVNKEHISFDSIIGVDLNKNMDGDLITILSSGSKKKCYVKMGSGEKIQKCIMETKKLYDLSKKNHIN